MDTMRKVHKAMVRYGLEDAEAQPEQVVRYRKENLT